MEHAVTYEHFGAAEDMPPYWAATCTCEWIADLPYAKGSNNAFTVAEQGIMYLGAGHLEDMSGK